MGGDADDLNAVAVIGGELRDVVVGAHGHAGVDGVTALGFRRQQAVQLLDGVADGDIAQEADLDDVGAGTGQGLDDAAGGAKAPVPIVDITAVTQGAIQQFYISHAVSPLKSC